MRALTHEEAVARRELLDIESYDVDLDLRDAVAGTEFGSRTVIRFRCRRPGAATTRRTKRCSAGHTSRDGVATRSRTTTSPVASTTPADKRSLPTSIAR